MILILEDNAERIQRFHNVLKSTVADEQVRVWSTAPAMIAEFAELLPLAKVISLDNDLEPISETATVDPGEGVDVVRILSEMEPVCPVIIHSSNRDQSTLMQGLLELGGWRYRRVAPLGEDWIERHWRWEVEELLEG